MTRTRLASLTVLLGTLLAGAHLPVAAQGNTPPSAAGTADTSGAPSTQGTAQSAPGTTTITVPMVILIPVEQENSTLNNGCWVRLTDKDAMPKKGNDILTVMGRMYMPSFETASGVNWSRKADSLTVGPKASVTVYSDRDFKGSSAKLTAGQQVKDLNKELGFVKSIDSLQVDCTA